MIAEKSILLGIDTAGSSCSVAVMKGGKILASQIEKMRRGQSERLLPMVQDVLKEAGLELLDMDGFAVTRGPGGFTGVRIGLAAAQGFSLACDKPLVGVNNFEVLARAVPEDEKATEQVITVLIDAKRADLFVQCFDSNLQALTPPFSAVPELIESQLPNGCLLLVGDGVDQAEEVLRKSGREISLSKATPQADASNLLFCVIDQRLFERDETRISPLYLRAPDVSLPKKRSPVA